MSLQTGRLSAKYALSVAAMVAAGGMALPAAAADLGGNCCADLEERVAELEATTARKGNRKVSLTIHGQVTTALMAWDDGDRTDVYIVDPPTVGGTFFQFSGDAKINPNLTAGFTIQVGLDFGARSHQVSSADDDGVNPNVAGAGAGDSTMVVTLANWYLDYKEVGRVTVGRINTATAGISGIDLGGANVIANVNVGYWQRSFDAVGTAFRWNDLLGGATVNGSTLSRANAISYTSPTVAGFQAAAAWGENDIWDVGLRYAGEHAGFRVAAGIGYASNVGGTNEVVADIPGETRDEPRQIKGSASILHTATGLYLSGSYVNVANEQFGNVKDTVLWYLNGGIAKNWTGLGNTVLYGEYATVDNAVVDTNAGVSGTQVGYAESTVWGLGIVQHIDAAAMELFLSYRHFDGRAPGQILVVPLAAAAVAESETAVSAGNSDMDVVMAGARIRF